LVEALRPQWGFYTPGQIMTTVGLLAVKPKPTRAEAAEALSGNLCRCGVCEPYLNAVMLAAQKGS
jgi:aerobic-type carbon monoxide dehydrogenase small subunit (CoxS/CutS family)